MSLYRLLRATDETVGVDYYKTVQDKKKITNGIFTWDTVQSKEPSHSPMREFSFAHCGKMKMELGVLNFNLEKIKRK